ncbi:probable peroxygenase 5 isoform X3 [Primulina eburnea]|uniref:probable peroxygenase 5 isoform X3 n=1 Tax=Primulina eburnea TaxID=1245227 RepID=UPI003C6C549D
MWVKGQSLRMENNNLNVLQKHIMFFDRDNDGIIYPSETFQGFRAVGCGIFLSSLASLFINVSLSRKTRPIDIAMEACKS